jgi:hypothetical protein
MLWWIIPLVYVAGILVTFRTQYPDMIEDQQRRRADNASKSSYERMSRSELKDAEHFDKFVLVLFMVFWPLVLVAFSAYCLTRGASKLLMKLLFPRGIVTKFDLEQRELAQKKEYEAARKALEAEGIKVELEE